VGDVDIALVATPQPAYPGLEIAPWRTTPLMAMLPARWKAPRVVTPAWLAGKPLIFNEPGTHVQQQVAEWFAAAGLRPSPRVEILYNEFARSLVAAGYGAAILPFEHPSETLEGRVRPVALRPALNRHLGVAHRAPALLDDATRRVLATVRGFGRGREPAKDRRKGGVS
jgi:DNA-binding transcriptional LysR family regulator